MISKFSPIERDVTAFIVQEGEKTEFHYDISTTVIDTNVSIGENLDLPCKNIFSVTTPIFLLKNPPEYQKSLLHWKLDRALAISRARHELSITSLFIISSL